MSKHIAHLALFLDFDVIKTNILDKKHYFCSTIEFGVLAPGNKSLNIPL